jgi:hypothetical protein
MFQVSFLGLPDVLMAMATERAHFSHFIFRLKILELNGKRSKEIEGTREEPCHAVVCYSSTCVGGNWRSFGTSARMPHDAKSDVTWNIKL